MYVFIMNNSVKIFSFLLLVCVFYTLFLYLKDLYRSRYNLTLDKIKALESIVGHAVNLSEQIYKSDKSIDKYKNTFDIVLEMTGRLGLKKNGFEKLIKTLIESSVFKLPRNN